MDSAACVCYPICIISIFEEGLMKTNSRTLPVFGGMIAVAVYSGAAAV
jgi:hypothetical protein